MLGKAEATKTRTKMFKNISVYTSCKLVKITEGISICKQTPIVRSVPFTLTTDMFKPACF